MIERFPEEWELLQIKETGEFCIFAGWKGSFSSGDYWRKSSPIIKLDFSDECLENRKRISFYTESGSVYHCMHSEYGVTGYNKAMLLSLLDNFSMVTSVDNFLQTFKG